MFEENGKSNNDVRDCVHIGALGKLLFPDNEGYGEGVYAPGGE